MRFPKVSVIIPNFNKAPFLETRIESILHQTYQSFEIILVDDASTDESHKVIQRFADDPHFSEIFYSEFNAGVFATWKIGIKKAKGEYIWIAEADDYADPRLLERLVGILEDQPHVGIAYCQSWLVDEHDTPVTLYKEVELPYWNQARWQQDFIYDGREECRRYLIYKNTIPNASAVVFRRALYQKTGGPPEEMKVNGDWVFWSSLLCHADIAFVAEPLNYFRTHSTTIRSANKMTGRNIEESLLVLQYFTQILDLSEELLYNVLRLNVQAWVSATFKYRIPFARQRRMYRLARSMSPDVSKILFAQFLNMVLHSINDRIIAPLRIKLKLGTRVKRLLLSRHSTQK